MAAADGTIKIDILTDDGSVKKSIASLNGLENASGEAGNGIKSLSGAMGLIKAAAIAAAGSAMVAGAIKFGKAAVSAYADYEQLVGGVETLFGAGGQSVEEYAKSVGKSVDDARGDYNNLMQAQDLVMKNADNAYKTAGMSANQYMEVATSSAAAMVTSVGGDTVKAAKLTDQAVTDMADNANKMGSNITDIQNAYGGFAKGNFTMLDNLKIGYGGTQEEMKRLLADAEKLPGAMGRKFDISNYADVTEAIHLVQTEMGITGTTAKEAAQTISGSIDSTKAALANLLAGLGKSDADLKGLTKNVIESFKNVVRNIIPVIKNIAKAIPVVIGEAFKLALPAVKSAFNDLIKSIGNSIPIIGKMFGFISDNVKVFKLLSATIGGAIAGFLAFKTAISIFSTVKTAIVGVKVAFVALKAAMLANPFGLLLVAVGALAGGLAYLYKTNENVRNGMDKVLSKVKGLVREFAKSGTVTKILAEGMKIISDVGNKAASIIANIGKKSSGATSSIDWFGIAFKTIKAVVLTLLGPVGLVIKIFELLAKVVGGGNVQKGLSSIGDGIITLVNGLSTYGPMIGSNFGKAINGIAGAIASALPGIVKGGLQIISGFILGIAQGLPLITASIIQLIGSITLTIITLVPTIASSAILIVTTLATSMIAYIPVVIGAITSIIVAVLGSLAQALPQIILAGTNLIVSFIAGITAALPSLIASTANLIITWLTEVNKHMPEILQAGFNLLITFLQGIANNISRITDLAITIIVNFANAIASRMPDIVQAAANLIVNFVNGIANNIGSIINSAVNLIVKFLEGIARKIPDIVNAAMDLVDALVRGLIQAQGRLMDAAIDLVKGMASNIKERQQDMRDAASELLEAIIGIFVPDSLINAGEAIINGFINGMKSAWEAGKNFVGGIGDWIQKHKGPISYDRKLLIPAGKAIMGGFNESLENSFKSVQDNISSMASRLSNNFDLGLPQVSAEYALSSGSGYGGGQAIINNATNNNQSHKTEINITIEKADLSSDKGIEETSEKLGRLIERRQRGRLS
ncbi:hypothetical protein ACL43R_08195 [Lactococcus formosensis]|uniref:hypothetical protein n=1 Tax=Lactococcus formosensis TaxID=1281486 RepID=UPI0039F67D2B